MKKNSFDYQWWNLLAIYDTFKDSCYDLPKYNYRVVDYITSKGGLLSFAEELIKDKKDDPQLYPKFSTQKMTELEAEVIAKRAYHSG